MTIKMTYLEIEFLSLCNEYLIHPAIAIENELIQEALKSHNIKEIKRILGYPNKKGEEQCKKEETYTK